MYRWHPEAIEFLEKQNYDAVISLYERLIEEQPENAAYYCYLGLANLLQGNEEAAQDSWWFIISQAVEDETSSWIFELINILEAEAQHQQKQENWQNCWTIRSCINDLSPENLNNFLEWILLTFDLVDYTPKLLSQLQIIEKLRHPGTEIDQPKLLAVLQRALNYPAPETLEFAEVCVALINPLEKGLNILIEAAAALGYYHNLPLFSIELIQLCLKYKPGYLSALENLPRLYIKVGDFRQAIDSASEFYNHCTTPELQFFSNAILLKALLSAGAWSELAPISTRHKALIKHLVDSQNLTLSLQIIKSLAVFTGFLFYLEDNLPNNRSLQNKAAKLFCDNVQKNTQIAFPTHQVPKDFQKRPLRIGYVAHTLKSHSVGWLSRWLFRYHNHKDFHISTYLLAQSAEDPFFQTWFAPHVNQVHVFMDDVPAAVEQIQKDKIDILIDLDSTTLDDTVALMSLKPAPIQVTWLGWDASGLPTVDYFIADPYVLAADADIYYQEKLWRLPHTYLAVDGFEVGVPTLSRQDLNIASDAVVFLSSQVGMKRHPDTIRLQLEIIKEVPNSYFLIKGLSDNAMIQDFFRTLAQEIGLSTDRLRFLPMAPSELIHRANLQLADIVLDTYPYNGATTTLETLWMGIPIVTRVGHQFSARNSYTFLTNVGVREGIAWTDEEYVRWGIQMGRDEKLRQQVAWKLKQSRRNSPLWNAQQFTLEMENAYQQMWLQYLQAQIPIPSYTPM